MARSWMLFPKSSGKERCKAGPLLLLRATDSQLNFLQALYAEWQGQELALLPWPDDEKRRIIGKQFELQHNQWVTHYPHADFWIVAGPDENALGRFYLDRSTAPWRIVDILLCEGARSAGAGTALIRWVQHEAAAAGASVTLQVAANNQRARSLYERLGFTVLPPQAQQMHLPMQWSPLDEQT